MKPTALFRTLAFLVVPLASAALLPSNPGISLTNNSLTVLDPSGHIVSTATVCAGYTFSQLGTTGPKLSPDRHWILVDILGPYEPGNVGRNHALVQVATGKTVTSPNFKAYLGVPGTLQPLSWVSGEREALRYADGTTAPLHDPPRRPIPYEPCAPPAAV